MRQAIFPYKPDNKAKFQLRPVNLDEGGTEGMAEKSSWISDGPLRQIEMGLPIYGTLPPALDPSKPSPIDNMVNVLVNRPYAKDYNKMYKGFATKYPEYDINDPDTRSFAEKQFIALNSKDINDSLTNKTEELRFKIKDNGPKLSASTESSTLKRRATTRQRLPPKYTTIIPPDAYLQTFGGAIPYFQSQVFEDDISDINDKPKDEGKRVTGISGPRKPVAGNQSSLIRELHFASLSNEEVEAAKTDDSPFVPLKISERPTLKPDNFFKISPEDEDTCQKCLKKYFDPTVGKPFVPKNAEQDFPPKLFDADPQQEQKAFGLGSNAMFAGSNFFESSLSLNNDDDASVEIDPKSTLVESKQDDILFTADKLPFTRNDVAELRAFTKHWDNLVEDEKKEIDKKLINRRRMIKKTFESKEVFENYLKLLEEDCKRIHSGLIGKGKYKKKSMWEVAVKTAKKDPTALHPRREFWWRLGAYCKSCGGMKDLLEKEYVNVVRDLLINRHPVDESLFWDTLDKVSSDVLENIASLGLIEFSRIVLDVPQVEFDRYLDKRHASRDIYIQTIVNSTSRETLDNINKLAKGKIEVPESN